MKTRTRKRNLNATAYPAGWARVGSTEWLGFEAWMLKTFGVPHMKSKIGQQLENAAWNGWMAALVWQRTGKVVNSMKPNDKVSDGGPLTPELKQDANPPFAAPLG